MPRPALPDRPGQIIALRGRPGSGRTALLLAMAGHYRGTPKAGGVEAVTLADGGEGTIGTRTALGLVANAHEPAPMLTAGEQLDERGRPLSRQLHGRRRGIRSRG